MAMPRKNPWRRITLEGTRYRWRLSGTPLPGTPDTDNVSWRFLIQVMAENAPGSRLTGCCLTVQFDGEHWFWIASYNSTVGPDKVRFVATPKLVALAIRTGLARGWQPTTTGPAFIILDGNTLYTAVHGSGTPTWEGDQVYYQRCRSG
jgi:hypothetical protein